MKIYLSRWVCLDVEANVRRVRDEVCRAAMDGAAIVVLPELCLTGYRREIAADRAREVFSAASSSFPDLLCVFGSISEDGYNRMTAWTGGEEVARYDKVHLFHPNREAQMWQAGSRYAALSWQGTDIGFLVCNDLRYPEQARALRLQARSKLLIIPAWWPWRRDHVWRTLLRARAIENGVWTAGCCIANSVHPGEDFAGAGNYVFDPLGEQITSSDDHIYVINLEHPPQLIVDPLEHPSTVTEIETFSESGTT